MLVLIPWKPVVLVWLLLSGVLYIGFIVSSLMNGWNPFVPRMLQTHRAVHVVHHHRSIGAQTGVGALAAKLARMRRHKFLQPREFQWGAGSEYLTR